MTTERLRLSLTGALVATRTGQLVWDDYLEHHQYALRPGAELMLSLLREWRGRDEVREWASAAGLDAETAVSMCDTLAARRILVRENSERALLEDQITDAWSDWGLGARHFHYASRTLERTPFATRIDDEERLRQKLRETPPPPPFKVYEGASQISLPPADEGFRLLGATSLSEALRARRSTRELTGEALALEELSALLAVAGRAVRTNRAGLQYGSLHKTSASGGARHPTEFYAYIARVNGVKAGIYHYNGRDHVLEHLGGPIKEAALVDLVGGQEWVRDASVLIFHVGVTARSRWKYDMSRAYRALYIDVGHLSQTLYLCATALDIGITFIGSFRDEPIEKLAGLDPVEEIVIGASVVGRKRA